MPIPQQKIKEYLANLKETFEYLYLCLESKYIYKDLSDDALRDPNSPEVCIILYLYTIEPSFYYDIKKAIKSNDKNKI